jgi:SAM-dependent methyltransferase
MAAQGQRPFEFNTSVPHPARIYDYLLGGKDNFPADRAAAEATLAVGPEGRAIARANRRFLIRAVRFLAEQGIRQFIDIGTGIPTSPNVHEAAHAVAPDARVIYVDNDPLVLAHARALLRSHGPGETRFIQADLRDPEAILGDPNLVALIDFAQPLAVLLVATLHHIPDAEDPAGIVARLLAPAAPGSYLVVSQLASDLKPERAAGVAAAAKRSGVTLLPRRRDEVLRFFAGLDLVEPGLVQPPLWRPDPSRDTSEEEENLDLVWFYAGVGRKP